MEYPRATRVIANYVIKSNVTELKVDRHNGAVLTVIHAVSRIRYRNFRGKISLNVRTCFDSS